MLTDVLLRVIEQTGMRTIVDLLSVETYQQAISGRRVYDLPGITCYRRCFELKAGPETLHNLGMFFANEVLGSQLANFTLHHDRSVRRNYFDDPTERLVFEKQIMDTKKAVAREGL